MEMEWRVSINRYLNMGIWCDKVVTGETFIEEFSGDLITINNNVI